MLSIAKRLAEASRRPWPDRPVRVALVITELEIGGAERALVALAMGLDRSRWEVHVIALGPEGPLAGPLRESGLAVTCLDVSRGRPWRAITRLVGALRAFRPELAQSFLFHANIAVRLAAPLAGRPWVVGGLRVAEREKAWHRWLDRWTSRLSAGSACVSEGVRRFSREVSRLPEDRLVVIPNGVDPAPFDRARPADRAAIGVPESAHLVLFVGRLTRQKGVSDLLEAAHRVASRRPDWFLALAGDGPDQPTLESITAADPLLSDRVRWLGPRDDIPSLLKTADVLVLPSRWEGMPNVVLEAMAAGKAVIGTEVEGTSELVEPGRTGWLVPPGAPPALADALEEAATDPERLRRFGRAGRDRVAAEFAPTRVVRAHEDLWAGLLGLDPVSVLGK